MQATGKRCKRESLFGFEPPSAKIDITDRLLACKA
jgi:hypothetical protein